MSNKFLDQLEKELQSLCAEHLYRKLPTTSTGLHNFSSNDYLGLATNAELRDRVLARTASLPLSASSSRLLPGYVEEHERAELEFCAFLGAPAALVFNSGYAANVALLTTLAGRHDLILYDERSHASWYEGLQSTRATSYKFKHNDVADLERLINAHREKYRTVFVVIESVYSMDGDEAPLVEIANLAARSEAMLIVDEAHATGIIGKSGEGMISHLQLRSSNVITVHPCGKALAASGAFLAGEKIIIDYLINRSRGFIYSTALPPVIAVQLQETISCLRKNASTLIAELDKRTAYVRRELQCSLQEWSVPEGRSPIIPIIIGDEMCTLKAAEDLREQGIVLAAIRPPTVPRGTSRLRLSVSLSHSDEAIESMLAALSATEAKYREELAL